MQSVIACASFHPMGARSDTNGLNAFPILTLAWLTAVPNASMLPPSTPATCKFQGCTTAANSLRRLLLLELLLKVWAFSCRHLPSMWQNVPWCRHDRPQMAGTCFSTGTRISFCKAMLRSGCVTNCEHCHRSARARSRCPAARKSAGCCQRAAGSTGLRCTAELRCPVHRAQLRKASAWQMSRPKLGSKAVQYFRLQSHSSMLVGPPLTDGA